MSIFALFVLYLLLLVAVSVTPTMARRWRGLAALGGLAAALPAYFWFLHLTADWDKESAIAGALALYTTGAWLLGMAAGAFAVVGARRGWEAARPPVPSMLAGLPTAAFCFFENLGAF